MAFLDDTCLEGTGKGFLPVPFLIRDYRQFILNAEQGGENESKEMVSRKDADGGFY